MASQHRYNPTTQDANLDYIVRSCLQKQMKTETRMWGLGEESKKAANLGNMDAILCPSSGATDLCLQKITLLGNKRELMQKHHPL